MILDLLAKQHVSDVNVASLYGRMALEGCYLADLHNERERDRGMVGMLLILSVCVTDEARVMGLREQFGGRNLAAWTEARAAGLL